MKIKLPQSSKGWMLDKLRQFEMNNFDVEEVLPSLFYLVATGGRPRSKGCPNDPRDVERYIDSLAGHSKMRGFASGKGRELLGHWVRATLIKVGALGKVKAGSKIVFVAPLTFLSYKAGLPKEITRLRKVHKFWYDAMHDVLNGMSVQPTARVVLENMFRAAFGQGVSAKGPGPYFDASFDDTPGLDVNTLLSLYFLDGFKPTESGGAAAESEDLGPALPITLDDMARDLLAFLTAYGKVIPTNAISRGLQALINFYLHIYTLKVVYATNELMRAGKEFDASDRSGGPELYIDFTRSHRGDSDNLARWCVSRDMEEFRLYIRNSIALKTIDRFANRNEKLRVRLEQCEDPSSYLSALAGLYEDPAIAARAEAESEAISDETTQGVSDAERALFEAWLSEEQRLSGSSLDMAIKLLVSAQEKNAVDACMKWFVNVGGLNKEFGLLVGARRNAARYAMTDDLLSALIRVAMTERNDLTAEARPTNRLKLGELMSRLYERFGILIDRPPSLMDNARARAASLENMEAFKRRLRHMGYFEALSDDFTAQYLRSAYHQVKAG